MTPKQRREQDILKRKTSDINKKYPQRSEPLSEFQVAFKRLKEQDPTSTVREGEFALLENSEGATDDARSTYNNFLQGAAEGAVGEAIGRKKGGMTKGQKKVGKVMSEFKSGKLKSSSGRKITNPKQAIAIGLSEAGMSKKKMQNGGMVRGQGAAIRGTKFKGIF